MCEILTIFGFWFIRQTFLDGKMLGKKCSRCRKKEVRNEYVQMDPPSYFVIMLQCVENCLASNYTKPGYCPERMSMTPFEAACLIACVDDSRCPDLAKCCSHDCGITCMHPIGLDSRNGKQQSLFCESCVYFSFVSVLCSQQFCEL